jgi:glutamine---fructose-6-phosphate transaminase (isomerizing)
MCGIFVHYGEFMPSNLVGGLQQLEYRGYDSAGIAVINDGKLSLTKSVGKVSLLQPKTELIPTNNLSKVGIAHTRWATHGNPTELNAHPHSSQSNKIAIVHNGIIDNYKDLRAYLVKRGIMFYSQTDTEVIAKLIELNYTDDLKTAVLDTLPMLKGSYSIAVISEDEPDRIIAVHNGCSLILGLMNQQYVLASDLAAIINHTRDIIYLDSGEIIDIHSGGYNITDLKYNHVIKQQCRIEWDTEQASKSGYKHYLLKEIMEQASSVEGTIRNRMDVLTGEVTLNGLDNIKSRLPCITNIVLLGIGTSYYAAKMGELYFEELTGLPCKAEMTPEFRLKSNTVSPNTWVIALSQSGETYDTIHAIKEAQVNGALVTAIVNVVGSTVSRLTEAGVYNQIGPEISVASTKAFSSQVLLLLLHAMYFNQIKGKLNPDGLSLAILELPAVIDVALISSTSCYNVAKAYHHVNDIYYLGLKYNYPIALEGALKLKEISPNIHAEGLSAGELKHGFIAMIDENRPTIAINPSDSVHSKTSNTIEQVKARGGKVIQVVTTTADTSEEDDIILVPPTHELIQPIICNIVLQLFAYHCSVLNEFDVDRPRNLAKSVTVE